MKTKINYLLNFVIVLLFSISSANADNWRVFTYGVTYANSEISPTGKIPKDRNIVQAFRLPNGNTLCVMSTGNPIIIGPDADLTTEYDSDFAELKLKFNPISTSVVDANGTFYIQAVNGIAYLDKTSNKWRGYNISNQFNNGILPDIPFENLFGVTIDVDNNLFISGTKEGLPAVATLKGGEWIVTMVDDALLKELKKAELKANQGVLGFKNVERQSLLESFILASPVSDADGDIWMLLGSKGFRPAVRFKGGTFTTTGKNYNAIVADLDKNLFLAGKDVIEMVCAKTGETEIILNDATTSMAVANGALWFGINKKSDDVMRNWTAYLKRYNIDTKSTKIFKTNESPVDFPLIWLHSDSLGNLSMTTGHSLFLIDRKNMSKYDDKWECYSVGHLDEIDFLKYYHTGMSRGGLYPVSVSWMLGENNNRLVGIFKEGKWEYHKMDVDKEATLIMGMKGTKPISACYTTKGIFIGTDNDGLMIFDPATQKASNVTGYDLKSFDKTVNAIVEDKNGIIWLGTDKGLVKYDGKEFQLFEKKKSEFKSDKVNCLYISPSNILWIASGDGIFSFDGTQWKQFGKKEGLKVTNVYRITGIGETIYATTYSILKASNDLYTIENNMLKHEELPFKIWKDGVMADENNNLWISGMREGILCRKPDGTSKIYNASNSPIGFSGRGSKVNVNFMHAHCGGGKLYVDMHETFKSQISDSPELKSLIDYYEKKVDTFNRIMIYVMDLE